MTSHLDSVLAERQSLLDDLNLPMLFLESARVVSVADDDVPDATDAGSADPPRRLRLRVLAHAPLTPATTAALLCRVLHNNRIPGVEIDRVVDGVRLRCFYFLPTGRWRLDITAPIA
jgi:hypothetical protein